MIASHRSDPDRARARDGKPGRRSTASRDAEGGAHDAGERGRDDEQGMDEGDEGARGDVAEGCDCDIARDDPNDEETDRYERVSVSRDYSFPDCAIRSRYVYLSVDWADQNVTTMW